MNKNKLPNQTQSLIIPDHLQRLAIMYCRQSANRKAGAEHQRSLVALARSYRWTDHQIQIIDEDLGKAGSSSVQRAGWHRLQDLIDANPVGAVFVLTLSRLSRQVLEFEVFCLRAGLHNTLLYTDGRLIDLTGERDRILSRLVSMRDRWFANQKRRLGKRHAALSRRRSARARKQPRPVLGKHRSRGKKP